MDPTPPIIPKGEGFSGLCKSKLPITLPSWLTEEDVSFYAKKFDETGFTGGLNYYRALSKYAPFSGFNVMFGNRQPRFRGGAQHDADPIIFFAGLGS